MICTQVHYLPDFQRIETNVSAFRSELTDDFATFRCLAISVDRVFA
jgi:hypothetical protein